MKHWVADRSGSLGELVTRVFGDADALAEGRVFVDRSRTLDPALGVRAGMRIEVGQRVAREASALSVLYEDDELIAVDKPAGLVSVPDHHGHDSLQARVAAHRGLALTAVHPTSRLDRGVSGVVVFALAARAREALAAAREHGSYARLYLALSERGPGDDRGVWDGAIGRHPRDARKRAVGGRDATHARTRFEVLARAAHGVALALRPETGRTHQLRVHAAHAGVPLDGDADYRGRRRFVTDRGEVLSLDRIALHAHRVQIPHRGAVQVVRAELPHDFVAWWQRLGGQPNDLHIDD